LPVPRCFRFLCAFASLFAVSAAHAEKLEIAYIPILPMAQLYVIDHEGWAKEAGLELALTKFSSGPAIVQAIASGRYDVMYFGIGPAMVARAKGVPIKVVASNVVEQIGLIVEGALADAAPPDVSPADAIRHFTATEKRKPKIATLPKGAVPDIVLRYWLQHAGLGVDAVEIVGMGEDKVQQALLTHAIDGASILEPIVSIVESQVPGAKVIVGGRDMFPDNPGAVVAVRESALAAKRDAIQKLVALHIRATDLLIHDPDRAAKDVYAALGQGLIAPELMEKALKSPLNHFVSDPRTIVAATRTMEDFSREIGALDTPVDVDQLFDTSLYVAASTGK
jgi:NitT/TauT family transport system substrate-binding protein